MRYREILSRAEKAGACKDYLEIAKKYKSLNDALKDLRASFMAYWYAVVVIGDRVIRLEKAIMRDPGIAYQYARDVIKGRWLEAELAIKRSPVCIYLYARDVIHGRWIEAEPIIFGTEYEYLYCREIMKSESTNSGQWINK